MESLITNIPEDIVPNTVIETSDNTCASVVEFLNPDLSYEKGQRELYGWKFATLDCFKDEFYDDTDEYGCIFIEGYMTEEEAIEGHGRIVNEILVRGRAAECLV